jgi:hypothetical protein
MADAPPVKKDRRRRAAINPALRARKVASMRRARATSPRGNPASPDAPASPQLTDQQERFVLAYAGPAQGDKTEAARMAGYSFPETQAIRLLTYPHVRQAIEERTRYLTLDADDVLRRLARIATADMGDFANLVGETERHEIERKLKELRKRGLSSLIAQLVPTKYGMSVKLHDSQQALQTIARCLGMLKDRLEVSPAPPSYDPASLARALADPETARLACELDRRLNAARSPQASLPAPDGPIVLPSPTEGLQGILDDPGGLACGASPAVEGKAGGAPPPAEGSPPWEGRFPNTARMEPSDGFESRPGAIVALPVKAGNLGTASEGD